METLWTSARSIDLTPRWAEAAWDPEDHLGRVVLLRLRRLSREPVPRMSLSIPGRPVLARVTARISAVSITRHAAGLIFSPCGLVFSAGQI